MLNAQALDGKFKCEYGVTKCFCLRRPMCLYTLKMFDLNEIFLYIHAYH